VHGGLLSTWVKYNQNYFVINTPFWGTHLQLRSVDEFLRMIAQTTLTRARICIFRILSHSSQFRGSNHFKTPNFGAWIGVFKPKSRNRKKTCILSKLLYRFYNQIVHSDRDHQMPFVGGPNTRITYPRWRTAAILEHLKKIEKLPYLSSSSSNVDEIWHDDAVRLSRPFQPLNFEKPSPSWKIEKWHISAMVWAISTKLGTVTQYDLLDCSDR